MPPIIGTAMRCMTSAPTPWLLVKPAKHSNVKAKEGQAFIDWLISSEGQPAIVRYKINGEQLFFSNAGQPS